MINNMPRIIDIFGQKNLQDIQDAFARTFDAAVLLADPDGFLLTMPSNWSAQHPVFGGDPLRPRCHPFVLSALMKSADDSATTFADMQSPSTSIACIPFLMNGQLVGAWVVGYIAQEDVLVKASPLPLLTMDKFASMHEFILTNNRLITQSLQAHDITEEYTLREALTRVAYYDRATALPNSEKFLLDMEDCALESQSGCQYLVCFDLTAMNNFYSVYGHKAGLAFLEAVCNWVREHVPSQHVLYRLADARFCLRLPYWDENEARDAAQAIFDRFGEAWAFTHDSTPIVYFCTASVSLISDREGLYPGDEILELIERTLSNAARQKRLFIHDRDMDRQTKDIIQFEMALKNSVLQGMAGFAVHYQPIVAVGSGQWMGLEALCRWTNAQGEFVSPDVFIPEAEKTGLINSIGLWVLQSAIDMSKRYALDALEGFYLSVNVSPVQMMQESFPQKVLDILRTRDYPGEKLNLEITESTEFPFNDYTFATIDKLRDYGIRIALDDFGTGYASFYSLKTLPVSFLKTERKFVENIEQDTYLQYFFYIMSELAHANNMKLIAEGIETREQYEVIKNNGADYIQGFYFSRPLPEQVLAQSLDRFSAPDPSLADTNTPKPLDINQWLHSKEAYVVTPSLFLLLNQCMQILLSGALLDEAFPNVLQTVGEYFGVRRAYAYVVESQSHASRIHEWAADGVKWHSLTKRSNLQSITTMLHTAFQRDGMLIAPDATTLPAAVRKAIAGADIASLLVLPMWNEHALLGWIGFDDCKRRDWSSEEIIMIWNLGMVMINNIMQESLRSEVIQKQNVLLGVLNGTGINVVVSDIENHAILWANDSFRKLYSDGTKPLEGQKCYRVLHDRPTPCAPCVLKALHKSHSNQHSFEFYSERLKQTFIAYSSIVDWVDGRKALFEYFINISDYKKSERQLHHIISTDMLTSALNERALKASLLDLLEDMEKLGQAASIAYVDIDNLRKINAQYGLSNGDSLLRDAVEAIRQCTRSDDVVGRIGNDEFVVLFRSCHKKVAHARMLKARLLLEQMNNLPSKRMPASFSFGIAENSEVVHLSGQASADELLRIARKRMHAFKRQTQSSDA